VRGAGGVALAEALRWGRPCNQPRPQSYAEPGLFDIDRTVTGHTGGGHGSHFCVGAHLARLEVTVALNLLFDRIAHLEFAGPVTWTTTPSLSGPTSVPLSGLAARGSRQSGSELCEPRRIGGYPGQIR
jgi:hypothetical protein